MPLGNLHSLRESLSWQGASWPPFISRSPRGGQGPQRCQRVVGPLSLGSLYGLGGTLLRDAKHRPLSPRAQGSSAGDQPGLSLHPSFWLFPWCMNGVEVFHHPSVSWRASRARDKGLGTRHSPQLPKHVNPDSPSSIPWCVHEAQAYSLLAPRSSSCPSLTLQDGSPLLEQPVNSHLLISVASLWLSQASGTSVTAPSAVSLLVTCRLGKDDFSQMEKPRPSEIR